MLSRVETIKIIKSYVELMRPALLLGILLTFYLGLYWSTKTHIHTNIWLPLAVSLLLAFSFGNIINDVYDQDVDSINEPERPLVSGRLSTDQALLFAKVTMICAIFVSYTAGAISVLATASIIVLGILYSHPKYRFSRKYLASTLSLILAYYLIPFWIGYVLISNKMPGLDIIFLFISLLSFGLAKILLKDLKDLSGDEKYAKNTPLIALGRKKVLFISSLFSFSGFTFLTLLSKFYISTVYVPVIMIIGVLFSFSIIYPAYRRVEKRSWKQIQRVLQMMLFIMLLLV